MAPSEQAVFAAIQTVIDPNTGKDFVSTKQVKNLRVAGDAVSFDVELGYPAKSQIEPLTQALTAAVMAVDGVGSVQARLATKIVAHAVQLLARDGWRVVNADLTLLAEAPRISTWRAAICQGVAEALQVPLADVNLKATTTEKLGYIGRTEGLAAQAVVLIARG